MSQSRLPDAVVELIRRSVPSIDALEILVYVARRRGAPCWIADIIASVRGSVSESSVREYLGALRHQGVLEETAPGGFMLRDSSTGDAVAALALLDAYDQLPVTLIRTVYEMAEGRSLRSFVQAFDLRRRP